MLTLKEIKSNSDFQHMIKEANHYLSEKGYTEHGFRHVNYVSRTTERILKDLGFDKKTVELGTITGYLHDIGNMFNRKHHGISGANIVYTELRRMDVPLEDITKVTTAIANHDVEIGQAVSPITAALILADKSDAHRTRVNKKDSTFIHDRVNLAIMDSKIYVEPEEETITLSIDYDSSISQVMDFFEIYLYRMELCKDAAKYLGCRFRLLINDLELLGHVNYQEK
jgi:putative nucleotidyltransferase with HDIG domain